MNRSLTSILGIIALILVIVAAVVYLRDESDDAELKVDIGMVGGAPASVLPSATIVAPRRGRPSPGGDAGDPRGPRRADPTGRA